MPLKLIAEEQIEDVEWGGATFRIQVRAGPWWESLRDKYATPGKPDSKAWEAEALEGFVKGWENVLNQDGSPLEFSPDRVAEVFAALPEDCTEELWRVARGRHLRFEATLGN